MKCAERIGEVQSVEFGALVGAAGVGGLPTMLEHHAEFVVDAGPVLYLEVLL